ncbi:MAG: 3-hydroxyisobutyrate dehydrogenase [Candidatus Competibacter phosphatis]
MATIAFIGLGKMGVPMALNLAKAGHAVLGFDLSAAARQAFAAAGGTAADTLAGAVGAADVVISMVNAGRHVMAVYGGEGGAIALSRPDALLIDSSTIDVATARAVAGLAAAAGKAMLDAPVSGGDLGAKAGTLTFMVGGTAEAFARGRPVFEAMGRTIVHAGPNGNGQAAKICNNMMAGINMISASEGFALARKLGLDAGVLHAIASTSSGASWALNSYCPVPGPVPAAPSNRDYEPGFTCDLMLKDMRLSQEAAALAGAATPLGGMAAALYQAMANNGFGGRDFSVIARLVLGEMGEAENG